MPSWVQSRSYAIPKLLLLAFGWSLAFWGWHGVSFWLGMLAFGIDTGFASAIFTEAVVGFGVALPSAPGFFGTFHFAANLALSDVYGVAEPQALAFAFGYHFGGWVPITLIGLWYAWRLGISLGRCRGGGGGGRGGDRTLRTPQSGTGGGPVTRAVHVTAPAKVNLSLGVLHRRADGYHEIETIFQAIDLVDDVTVALSEGAGLRLEVEGTELGPPEENLAYQAADRLREVVQLEGGLDISLSKRIPLVPDWEVDLRTRLPFLKGVARLYGIRPDDSRIRRIAAELGSDVPFFMSAHARAMGRGRGREFSKCYRPYRKPISSSSRLRCTSLRPGPTVVFRTSAARARGLERGSLHCTPGTTWRPPPTTTFSGSLRAGNPEVGRSLAALGASGAEFVLMSGSGSSSVRALQ